MISPHPGRETFESNIFARLRHRDGGKGTSTTAHIAVDGFGIGPVGFGCYDVEAVVGDQVLCYFCSGGVEF